MQLTLKGLISVTDFCVICKEEDGILKELFTSKHTEQPASYKGEDKKNFRVYTVWLFISHEQIISTVYPPVVAGWFSLCSGVLFGLSFLGSSWHSTL